MLRISSVPGENERTWAQSMKRSRFSIRRSRTLNTHGPFTSGRAVPSRRDGRPPTRTPWILNAGPKPSISGPSWTRRTSRTFPITRRFPSRTSEPTSSLRRMVRSRDPAEERVDDPVVHASDPELLRADQKVDASVDVLDLTELDPDRVGDLLVVE